MRYKPERALTLYHIMRYLQCEMLGVHTLGSGTWYYMQWYRDKRIKLSLGGLSPMEYRRSLGIA